MRAADFFWPLTLISHYPFFHDCLLIMISRQSLRGFEYELERDNHRETNQIKPYIIGRSASEAISDSLNLQRTCHYITPKQTLITGVWGVVLNLTLNV